jgi:hypothetical protein
MFVACLLQTRAEFLGAFLAGMCTVLPELEERLQELQPGRGRQKAAEQVDGATKCFHLASSLNDDAKKVGSPCVVIAQLTTPQASPADVAA